MYTCGCQLDKGVCEEGQKLHANLSKLAQAPERLERLGRGSGDSKELRQAQDAWDAHLRTHDDEGNEDLLENSYLWLG